MQNNETKKCILYDNKLCTRCGECDMCDLDPTKVCDNCERCLHAEEEDYSVYEFDMHPVDEDESVLDDPGLIQQLDSRDNDDWLADFYNGGSESDDDFNEFYDDADYLDDYNYEDLY